MSGDAPGPFPRFADLLRADIELLDARRRQPALPVYFD
jgi:hypothetical protein